MRQLPSRPRLPAGTARRLRRETSAIQRAGDAKTEAQRRYTNARGAAGFKPVVAALRQMAGPGERCMFCSGSEAAQVEHFRPKAVFPELAMSWENFLWACGICNLFKREQFPTESHRALIDPSGEHVWQFFFFDEFGNLTPRWRTELNAQDPRALSTQEILSLDRQALQESRQLRLVALKQQVRDSINLFRSGQLDRRRLRARHRKWLRQPFQPDVADWFLNGPGRSEAPFAEFFDLLED
jgi:uncharacterized protein (TIGR02646 family)